MEGLRLTNQLRSRLAIILAPMALWILLFPTHSPLLAMLVEQVIVVVNGDPYTLSDLDQYATTKTGAKLPTSDFTKVSQDAKSLAILEQFITDKLIAAEVKRLGIIVGNEQIDRFIEMIKKKNQLTDAQLTMALRRDGMDMERYRKSIRTEIEKERLVRREVKAKVSVTPEDIKRYYQANKNKFRTKDRVRLRHILIQVPDNPTPEEEKAADSKALEIRKLAIAGESFAQLARKYSQGAGASEGGEIGWLDRPSLINELADAAFNMSAGGISQPIRTTLGVHILKVEDRDLGSVLPLSEVEGKIKVELNAKVSEELFLKWLKTDLRKNHQVDVKVPGVVFRAEETKEGTVNALMASESSREPKERSLLSKLNPFSYIIKSTSVEEEEGEYPSDERTVSIFGIPIFQTESAGDLDEDVVILSEPAAPAEGTAQAKEPTGPEASQEANDSKTSKGFFSKVLDGLNPF